MAQRLLIKWKKKGFGITEGTVRGDSEPTFFINGSYCLQDMRESRKSTEYILPKTYRIASPEDGKYIAEDLVLGNNLELHERNRQELIGKNNKTAQIIADADKLIQSLKAGS